MGTRIKLGLVLSRERTRPGLGIIEPCLRGPTSRPRLNSQDQARRLPHSATEEFGRRTAHYTRWKRFLVPVSPYRNGREQAVGSLMLDRQRGYVCDENASPFLI